MKIERVVLDSNVLISAALSPAGPVGRLYRLLYDEGATLLYSDETLHELQTRLMREKFDRYVSRRSRQAFLAQLLAVSENVTIFGQHFGCRDPDDDRIFETALVGGADYLVTGDEDLLQMNAPAGPPIVTPRQLLELL